MAWEMALFRRTRLADYQNCMKLFEAYAQSAPLWERTLLSAYVGIGPPLARVFGGNTRTVWQQAESIIGDLFAVSQLTPLEVVSALRRYIKLKRESNHHLPFEEACQHIYDQSFYPLVTHFTFAFQSSAVARLRFVKRIATATAFSEATVLDLGCGSGTMLCEVLKLKNGWRGYGLDVSRASVEYARRLVDHKGLSGRAQLQQGNITNLPFETASVDLVVASEVIEHVSNPQTVLAEIARVLAPGGFLAMTIPIESRTPAHVNLLRNAEEFCLLCAEAGLSVRSVSSRWHVTFGDDRRHLFAVAQLELGRQEAHETAYSLPVPQMSSAASSGIVSS